MKKKQLNRANTDMRLLAVTVLLQAAFLLFDGLLPLLPETNFKRRLYQVFAPHSKLQEFMNICGVHPDNHAQMDTAANIVFSAFYNAVQNEDNMDMLLDCLDMYNDRVKGKK